MVPAAVILLVASIACERVDQRVGEPAAGERPSAPQASRPRAPGLPTAILRLPPRHPSTETASLAIHLISREDAMVPVVAGVEVFEGTRSLGAVAAGGDGTFAIAATSPKLQRVTLDDTVFLLDAQPGEVFHLSNHYPDLWDLRGRAPKAGRDGVTCVPAGEACPTMCCARLWGEPGCEDEAQHLCTPVPRIRVLGPALGPIVASYADPAGAFSDVGPATMSQGDLAEGAETMWMPVARNMHHPTTVRVGKLQATLVIPAGAWWEIWVSDDGELTGRAVPRPSSE